MEIECHFEFKPSRKPKPQVSITRRKARDLPHVIHSLVLAHQIAQVLAEGRALSFGHVARQLGVTQSRVTQIMALLRLSPRLQETILLGDPEALRALTERRLRAITRERDWTRQEAMFRDLVTAIHAARPVITSDGY